MNGKLVLSPLILVGLALSAAACQPTVTSVRHAATNSILSSEENVWFPPGVISYSQKRWWVKVKAGEDLIVRLSLIKNGEAIKKYDLPLSANQLGYFGYLCTPIYKDNTYGTEQLEIITGFIAHERRGPGSGYQFNAYGGIDRTIEIEPLNSCEYGGDLRQFDQSNLTMLHFYEKDKSLSLVLSLIPILEYE